MWFNGIFNLGREFRISENKGYKLSVGRNSVSATNLTEGGLEYKLDIWEFSGRFQTPDA